MNIILYFSGMRYVDEANLNVLEEKIHIAFGIEPDTEIMDKMVQNINICVKDSSMVSVSRGNYTTCVGYFILYYNFFTNSVS